MRSAMKELNPVVFRRFNAHLKPLNWGFASTKLTTLEH